MWRLLWKIYRCQCGRGYVSELRVCMLYVSKLYVAKLCVSEFCESELCVCVLSESKWSASRV